MKGDRSTNTLWYERRARVPLVAVLALAWACNDDPKYIEAPDTLTIDPATADPDLPPEVLTLDLPVRLETDEEAARRAELSETLGIDVPVVRRDDLEVSIEWTVENLDEEGPAHVRVVVNGANEYFRYVPDVFVIDPEEDEPPPDLIDGVPFDVPAGSRISGVFREDQVREASFDLDDITRGQEVPFVPLLNIDEDRSGFTGTADGLEYPNQAIASMVRFEVGMITDRRARLSFAVRVRDPKGILHDELDSAPPDELIAFEPVDYMPPDVAP